MNFPRAATIAAIVLPAVLQAQTVQTPDRISVARAVDSVVRKQLAEPNGPASISVMMLRGKDTLVNRAWGIADVKTAKPATAAMTYRIASMSKEFTAALILKLVDKGKLSLGDSLSMYLKNIPGEWRAITIEQLLNHTAGLQNDYREHRPPGSDLTSQPADSLIAWAARDSLLFAPGTQYRYSNTGYMVLGVLIEKLYGKSYATVIRDEIARPLGLTTLGWCTSPEKRATQTMGHERSQTGALEHADDLNTDLALGAGGLCASAADMTRWNVALNSGKVLSQSSYAVMTTPRGPAARERYGFGIHVQQTPWGTTMLGHGGGTNGFLGESWWFPAESLSVTVLQNSEPSPPGTTYIAPVLTRIALGDAVKSNVAASIPDDVPASVRALLGFYEGPRVGSGLEVTYEKGTLYGNMNAGGRLPLLPQSGTTYNVGRESSPFGTVTFNVGADGKVVSVILRTRGREFTMPKVR